MMHRDKRNWILICMTGLVAMPVYAENQNDNKLDVETITKGWKCKYCPDFSEKQWEGYIAAGIGYVTNDSYKFAEYNGLNEQGVYVGIDFNNLYRDDNGNYWNIQGKNIGLDIPYLGIEGGHQGQYKLSITYDQLVHNTIDTARTPYSGGSTQSLPAGWVNAATTAGFTLDGNLHDVDFSTTRKNFSLGGEYIVSAQWSYEARFKRQTKEGNRPVAFTFGNAYDRVVMLPSPVDYTTDDIELKANYRAGKFNGQIALLHSKFENTNNFFRWENAYDSPTLSLPLSGVTPGQAATEPDNSKQQIMLSGNYTGIKDVQFTGLFSYAQLSQDDAFLPYTVNNTPVTPDLPANSLDGKVNVINANLAAHWQASPIQSWHAVFEHHEQDNNTQRYTYTYVIADESLTGSPRANFPYSFRSQKLKLDTDYRLGNQMKLSGGAMLSRLNRDYQSAEITQEISLWAKLKNRIDNTLQYSVKAEVADRSIDNYQVVSEVINPDNPLMRKYNMADREGRRIEFNLNYAASQAVMVNLVGDYATFDYSDTSVGLTESNEFTAGVDMQYQASKSLGFNGYFHHTRIESSQSGSQAFATADWTASNDDTILTIGLGSNYQVIENKLKLGLDFMHAESSSAISMSTGSPLPELMTKRDAVTVYADYLLEKNLAIKASYRYEKYDERDWHIDGVVPDTLSGVLSLGNTPPYYTIGVFWLSLRYSY